MRSGELVPTSIQTANLDFMLGDPVELTRPDITARLRSADVDLWRHASSVAQTVVAMLDVLPHLEYADRMSIVDAAWLHDIGKLTIPGEILNRPGPLSEAEWVEMRAHPIRGADYLERSPALRQSAQLVRNHHEWHDGRGYPDGKSEDQIELGARIIGVADAYDAVTSWRPYRPTLSRDAAIRELDRCAGTQFDPEIVDLLQRAIGDKKTDTSR
jgi:HD-GYP domain-containing protein (c-di-GMP phosphodiesterase class II)